MTSRAEYALDTAVLNHEMDTTAARGFMALFEEFRRSHDQFDGTLSKEDCYNVTVALEVAVGCFQKEGETLRNTVRGVLDMSEHERTLEPEAKED